jgi:phosphomannomutase
MQDLRPERIQPLKSHLQGLRVKVLLRVQVAIQDEVLELEKQSRRDAELPTDLDDPDLAPLIHARPSNTEPVVRLIAEAPSKKTALKLLNRAV